MTMARKEIVNDYEEGVYHCVSRCVRRAYLCGKDEATGRDFNHRKAWVRERLKHLAEHFAIDVFAYALLSNHTHTVLRNRPDLAAEWSDEEVARRWLAVFPKRTSKQGQAATSMPMPSESKIALFRQRLCSISWFMRCLNEYIARAANREDQCTGRFWEGRFKCQRLLDEGSVLACMAYVDLNPVRAKIAESVDQSEFTSAFDRIVARQAKAQLDQRNKAQKGKASDKTKPKKAPSAKNDSSKSNHANRSEAAQVDRWLCSIDDRRSRSATSRGIFSMSQDDYLELLDITGRILKPGKRGTIPPHLQPLLKRLNLDIDNWRNTVERFGKLFFNVAGPVETIRQQANQAGRKWYKGQAASQQMYVA
jgi:REP element-mobilizing transposase RayT